MRLLFLFLIVQIMLSFSAVNAQIYKWIDDKGKIHFSDTPPTNKKVTVHEFNRAGNPEDSKPEKTKPQHNANNNKEHRLEVDNFLAQQKIDRINREEHLKEKAEKERRPEECRKNVAKLKKLKRRARSAKIKGKHTKWLKLNEEVEELEHEVLTKCIEY